MTPIAVTIAGSDSSGGAGIQADLKTFAALRVYGASAITALTAQNTQGVQAILDVPPDFIAAQIDSIFTDLNVRAVKIGMLSRPETIRVVAERLRRHAFAIPIVLDPVMVATSGDLLISDEAVSVLRDEIMPLASVITPNLPEASTLLGEPVALREIDAVGQARRLLAMGAAAVVIKGGHSDGTESVDHFLSAAGVLRRFAAPRISTRNSHGTGCTLSSAIAAGIAHGLELTEAVARGKAFVTAAIRSADSVPVGQGSGPIHHFHGLWR